MRSRSSRWPLASLLSVPLFAAPRDRHASFSQIARAFSKPLAGALIDDASENGCCFKSPFSQAQREQHRHLFAVLSIAVAVEANQIALFELNGDENVSRGHDGEEEMPGGHPWRGPEGNDESEIKRMPHHPIQRRRFKGRRLIVFADQVVVNLLHPEETKVVDQIS